MEEKILEMLYKMDNRLDKMDQKIDNVKTELNQSMDDLRKEILDKQFVFEDEYGKKIDAIFDYVQFHQNNNLKRFDKISDLEKRVETVEVHHLNHEKRISALERKRG